jgi:hypothetical protein
MQLEEEGKVVCLLGGNPEQSAAEQSLLSAAQLQENKSLTLKIDEESLPGSPACSTFSW